MTILKDSSQIDLKEQLTLWVGLYHKELNSSANMNLNKNWLMVEKGGSITGGAGSALLALIFLSLVSLKAFKQ